MVPESKKSLPTAFLNMGLDEPTLREVARMAGSEYRDAGAAKKLSSVFTRTSAQSHKCRYARASWQSRWLRWWLLRRLSFQ